MSEADLLTAIETTKKECQISEERSQRMRMPGYEAEARLLRYRLNILTDVLRRKKDARRKYDIEQDVKQKTLNMSENELLNAISRTEREYWDVREDKNEKSLMPADQIKSSSLNYRLSLLRDALSEQRKKAA